MIKKRLLFSKTGPACYISHLDLLRTFQRVFRRAEIGVRHTEGFNPHPVLVFALPLPVGSESVCELLDAELLSDIPDGDVPERLNAAAPEGIKIITAYTPGRKFADIKWLEAEGLMCYDRGAAGVAGALTELFKSPSLLITKKTKKGTGDFDVSRALDRIRFEESGDGRIAVRAVVSAQEPTMNPDNLIAAIKTHLRDFEPDFARFRRLELYDKDHHIFR